MYSLPLASEICKGYPPPVSGFSQKQKLPVVLATPPSASISILSFDPSKSTDVCPYIAVSELLFAPEFDPLTAVPNVSEAHAVLLTYIIPPPRYVIATGSHLTLLALRQPNRSFCIS